MVVRHLDGAVVLGATMCAGALAWAAPWEAAAATALVLVAIVVRARARPAGAPRARARLIALAGGAMFLVGAARAAAAVRASETARASILPGERWPARCAFTGVIARSPVLLGEALRTDVDVTHASCGEGEKSLSPVKVNRRPKVTESLSPVKVTLHVPVTIAPVLARGDAIEGIAQLAPTHRFWNEDTGDPRPAQARHGVHLSGGAEDIVVTKSGLRITTFIDRLRDRFRRRILLTFPAATSPMARALVLGEDDLSNGDQRAFRRSGLAHLLAVSGMHLVLVVASFVLAMRAILVRITWIAIRVPPIRIASAIGIPIAWIYADLAGGSGSAMRAAWMTSIALAAHALSRKPDVWRALGLSVVGMCIVDPLVAYDLSFGLSIAATAGILALGPPIAEWALARTPAFTAPIVRAITTSIAASIACAPLLACMTGDLPLVGVVANVFAVPIGDAAALPLCLAHALLEPIPAAEQGCAIAASGALAVVRAIAHAASALSWSTVSVPSPTAAQLAVTAILLASCSTAICTRRVRRLVAGASIPMLLLLEQRARVSGAPTGVLRATFLDVGQGDAAIVDLPDGRAILIDGGGLVGSPVDVGERVLAPVLRARRRTAISAIVLSHPHPDHYGGLLSGTAATTIASLWDTGQGEHEGMGGAYADLVAAMRARHVPVLRPDVLCGTHDVGAGATIEVLAPCPGPTPDRGPNDNSLIVRVRYRTRSILFVGDAEHEEETDLVRAHAAASLRADVLKVGHHGSRTSSTHGFLDAVDPELAVISCGVRNRFGHPAAQTLATFRTTRARLLRTDQEGGVTITTDGRSLDVRRASD